MLDTTLLIWWLIAGWCGTPWPGRNIPPRPPQKGLLTIIVGFIGGLIGGWLFTLVWPPTESIALSIYTIASGLPAFAGARVLTDILGVFSLGPQPEPPD